MLDKTISELEIGKFYKAAPFPNLRIEVLDKTDTHIRLLRHSPGPAKHLRFSIKDFNMGKGGTGAAGCLFTEIPAC